MNFYEPEIKKIFYKIKCLFDYAKLLKTQNYFAAFAIRLQEFSSGPRKCSSFFS